MSHGIAFCFLACGLGGRRFLFWLKNHGAMRIGVLTCYREVTKFDYPDSAKSVPISHKSDHRNAHLFAIVGCGCRRYLEGTVETLERDRNTIRKIGRDPANAKTDLPGARREARCKKRPDRSKKFPTRTTRE